MSEIIFNKIKHEIRAEVDTLRNLVVNSLTKALEALLTADETLANEVIEGDIEINKLQFLIEDKVIRFMATQQPVASALRELVSVFKIVRSLERIGDYAGHIAKEGKRLSRDPYSGSFERLKDIIEVGIDMTRDSVTAYFDSDVDFAYKTAERDKFVDEEYKKFIKEVLEYLKADSDYANKYTRLISTANAVERLCDHATNICEAVVFSKTGQFVDLNDENRTLN